MNELLYKKSKAVGSLNRVEGFEPRSRTSFIWM